MMFQVSLCIIHMIEPGIETNHKKKILNGVKFGLGMYILLSVMGTPAGQGEAYIQSRKTSDIKAL